MQGRQLFASLDPNLSTAVQTHFMCMFPGRHLDDLCQTEDVYDAALYALVLQYESVFLEPPHDIQLPPTPVLRRQQ
jgi:hypothetical protein